MDHLDKIVEALNNAVHHTTGYTPNELWFGNAPLRQLAKDRSDRRRKWNSRNLRRVFPEDFHRGQKVLARDYESVKTNKFAPAWKGPFTLVGRISDTMWKAVPCRRRDPNRGRKPVLLFHEDQIQSVG